MSYVPSPKALSAADRIRLDAAAGEVIAALQDGGVPAVLLKGRSLARWLYEPNERIYIDVDILVEERLMTDAAVVMKERGFVQASRPEFNDRPWSDVSWFRQRDGVTVELHRTLKGIGAEPSRVWGVLSTRSRSIDVGRNTIPTLDEVGMCLCVALHAAQHGPIDPPLEDLRRAIRRADHATWTAAYALAEGLDAVDAFAAGLALLRQGEALRERLGVPPNRSSAVQLRAEVASNAAQFLGVLEEAPDLRTRVRLLFGVLFPSSDYLRSESELARKGPLGLALARVQRSIVVLIRGIAALPRWLRTRARVRRGSSERVRKLLP